MRVSKEQLVIGSLVVLFVISIIVGNGKSSIANKPGDLDLPRFTKQSSVAVVPLFGVISLREADFFMPSGASLVMDALEHYAKEKSVKAIVLRINSPGGHVGSSQELYAAIHRFRESTKKPVVVTVIDYGASGAYWAALAADYIIAHPGSMVGSMGVITQSLDLTKVKDEYGIGMKTYKAGAMKDLMNPWRPITAREKVVVNRMLGNLHRQFIDVVEERRHLDRQTAETLSDGRIYTGEQALQNGLIDQLGGLDDAVNYAAKLAGIKGKPHVVRMEGAPLKQLFQSFRNQWSSGLDLDMWLGTGSYLKVY